MCVHVCVLVAVTVTQLWSYKTGYPVDSSAAVTASGYVYIGSRDRKLYAFDASSGAVKWAVTMPASGFIITYSVPAVAPDGTVYIVGNGYHVWALDGVTGSVKWHFDGLSSTPASVSVGGDGTVFAGDQSGDPSALYALSPATGAVKWSYVNPSKYGFGTAAVSGNGAVYVVRVAARR